MNTRNFVGIAVMALVLGLGTVFSAPVALAKPEPAGSPAPAKATLALTSHNGGELIELGKVQDIKWTSRGYSAPQVMINVIKKVGTNPNRYQLVRTVSAGTANDGSATWVPARTDLGSNILVEVGCKDTKVACSSAIARSNLVVVDSPRYANTASAFSALERSVNK